MSKYIHFPGLMLFVFLLTLLHHSSALAIDAYLHLTDRKRPLYIQNVRFHFERSHAGSESMVVFIPEQGKYHNYAFTDIITIEFKSLAGSRNMQPVFIVRTYLRESAHFLDLTLLPLRKITGIHNGRFWKYVLTLTGDEDEKAMTLDKIRFNHWY